MKHCFDCHYYGEWMGTGLGYCSKLATTVFGDELIVEQPCHNDDFPLD
jgi:hypothetical protein